MIHAHSWTTSMTQMFAEVFFPDEVEVLAVRGEGSAI